MKILWQLSASNLKKYGYTSFLVILSVALTIAMISMVSMTMTSVFASYGKHMTREIESNASVVRIKELDPFLDAIGREHIAAFNVGIESSGLRMMLLEDDIYLTSSTYGPCHLDEPKEFCDEKTIIDGRASTSINEIVIPQGSPLQINDQVTIEIIDNETQASHQIEAIVVGRSKKDRIASFYQKPNEIEVGPHGLYIDLAFVKGTKNIDQLIGAALNNPTLAYEGALAYYNEEYNFFGGFQSKAPPVLYGFIVITLTMIVIVALATFSLIFNAFNTLFTHKFHTFGVLRSVGATQNQLKLVLIFEAMLLGFIGISLGLGMGMLLTLLLLKFLHNNLGSIFIDSTREIPNIFFNLPFPVLLIIIVGAIIAIALALIVMSRKLFKRSSLETLRLKQIKKIKAQTTLSTKPLKQYARFNIMRHQDYKGIKASLGIALVILIVINAWVGSLLNFSEALVRKHDTTITMRGMSQIDNLNQDMAKLQLILDAEKEIKSQVHYYETTYLTLNDEFAYHPNVLALNLDPEDRGRFDITILGLDNQSMKAFLKQIKASSQSLDRVVLYNHMQIKEYWGEDILLDYDGPMYDVKAEDVLKLTDGKVDLSIAVDDVIENMPLDFYYLDRSSPLVIISLDHYQSLITSKLGISYIQFLLESDLDALEIKALNLKILDQELPMTINLYSTRYEDLMNRTIKYSINTITTAVFIFIAIVILINMVSISMASYQKRKPEIAALRSLGAQRKDILSMFIYESIYSVGQPWLLGSALGTSLAYGIYRLSVELFDLHGQIQFSFPIKILILASTLVILIIIVNSYSLYVESKKLNLVEDLRAF